MSFILDALRKSETDRRRDETPGIASVPLAPARRQAPIWSWILIGGLSLAVVAVSIAWWQSIEHGAVPPTEVDRGLAAAPGEPASGRAPASSDAAPATATGSAAATAAAASTTTTPTDTTAAGTALLSIADLAAADPNLPPLTLELLVYDADEPSRRLAFINGARYTQGQRIHNGPTLVEIRADGAVLAHDGRRYLLTPR